MRSRLNLILTVALLATPAVRAQEPAGTDVAADKAFSPAAQAVVAEWRAEVAPLEARFAAIRPDLPVAANLAERVAVEQGMREALPPFSRLPLPEAERGAASAAIWSRLNAVDAANTAYVKSVIPADGWFRDSRDGKDTTRAAWLIVQHSPDQAFMREVLARMEPLARAGEVDGSDFALLYDRTEMYAGRPQYYGSQYNCDGGR